jgi:hypothetical protein
MSSSGSAAIAKKRWKWVKENPVSDGDIQFSIGLTNSPQPGAAQV